jgi:hypothetical protein
MNTELNVDRLQNGCLQGLIIITVLSIVFWYVVFQLLK